MPAVKCLSIGRKSNIEVSAFHAALVLEVGTEGGVASRAEFSFEKANIGDDEVNITGWRR